MEGESERVATFERHRGRLFGLAYRMLGTVEDAEDVLQETYLRWHRAAATELGSPEGWLVAVATRLCIDRLRRAATERAHYVGDWLPEPFATGPFAGADHEAERASDLSLAFVALLERLAPEERAALLLREVFDTDYAEIARVLGKREAAVRQMVHRARARVRADRARFPVPLEARERLVERFLAALRADDQETLLALVADDATWRADSGGKVPSTRRVVRGAARIVRLLHSLERKGRGRVVHELAWLNGEPTILTRLDGRVLCTTSVDTDGERVLAFYRVLNPDKLRHVESAGQAAR